MTPCPQTTELREGLDRLGIPYETSDAEGWVDLDEWTEVFAHHEQTDFIHGDRIYTVTYHWDRDADERKMGRSLGWPAFMECEVDGMSKMVEAWELLEELG